MNYVSLQGRATSMSWTAQDVGLVIRQTVRAFLRHRLLFVLTVLGVLVAGAVMMTLKPRYTATATVVVSGRAQQDPLAPMASSRTRPRRMTRWSRPRRR
ncbi:Wzz/FepE/Etk N-terminal domain-containing protein [Komagataeibacter rhaeticus]|nr:Wzz/FepE/Etk N-terminal domain-containing protein [Komagataeibacter rhaeticus]